MMIEHQIPFQTLMLPSLIRIKTKPFCLILEEKSIFGINTRRELHSFYAFI
jgi:hypothetical protein